MSELPKGWKITDIGSITTIKTGRTPSKSEPKFFNGNIPFVKPGDMDKPEPLETSEEYISQEGADEVGLLPKDTVLVSCIGNLGKVSILAVPAACNQQINAILPNDEIEPRYIYYWAKQIKGWLEANASATTVTIINKGRFSKAPLPLPPLPEQRRIVAKLDSLFARSRRARQELTHIPRLVEHYKQAILAKAFSGDTYPMVNLGDVLESTQNGLSKRSGEEGIPVNVMRLSDLQDANFSPSEPRTILLNNIERERFAATPGDVFCIRVNGSTSIVGRMFVFPNSENWAFCDHFIRIRVNQMLLDPHYLTLFFATQDARRRIETSFVSSAGQKTVSMKVLSAFNIPIPEVSIQREIVSQISHTFNYIDKLAQEATHATTLLDRLDQATLAKAFRGELVTHETAEPTPAPPARPEIYQTTFAL